MSGAVQPFTRRQGLRFAALMFGAAGAPIFWLGQVMLGYGISVLACYPADHPVRLTSAGALSALLAGVNIIAVVAAVAGFATAFWCLRAAPDGRDRFLALWGVFSSLCFLAAILFNIIASIAVPPCVQ